MSARALRPATRRLRRWMLLLPAVAATAACGAAHAATRAPNPAATTGPLTMRVLEPVAAGRCPVNPLPLTAADGDLARAAVLIAVSVQRDQADAIVRVVPMDRIDRAYAVHRCGTLVTDRSLVVNAFFPHMTFSAALSYDTFYVSRTPHGWSLWDLTPGGGD